MDKNTSPQDQDQTPPQKEDTGFTSIIYRNLTISKQIINHFQKKLNAVNTRIGRLPESAKQRKSEILDKELIETDKDLSIEFNAKMFELFNIPQSQMVKEGATALEAHAQLEKYQSPKRLRGMDKAVFDILEAYRNGEVDENFPVFEYLLNGTNRLGIVGKTLRKIRGCNAKTMRQQFEVYMITLYYTDEYAHAIKQLIDSLDNPVQQAKNENKKETISPPPDKTKLEWQEDLKHLTNFFISLRELNQLNATNSDIMGFIHLHFVDRFSKPYDLERLKNYLGENVDPIDKPTMKWLGRQSDLGYVWVNLYTPQISNRKHLFVHKPEKETVYKILILDVQVFSYLYSLLSSFLLGKGRNRGEKITH